MTMIEFLAKGACLISAVLLFLGAYVSFFNGQEKQHGNVWR